MSTSNFPDDVRNNPHVYIWMDLPQGSSRMKDATELWARRPHVDDTMAEMKGGRVVVEPTYHGEWVQLI